ncbi:MAG: TPM domain-containing protein [Candidatus Bipolaricaulota bacterium]|nr:TPM domain-containing protein [Candidatus Bipolaricaulota bacterium]
MIQRTLALLLFVSWGVLAQEIPAFQGYVSDYAGILSPQMQKKLATLLQELEQKTTAQIAVLTVKTTQPLDDFQYAVKVFDSWKIGQKGKDNGALFFVATEDRRVRILTGYGLEGILPDGKVGAILDEFVLPEFRAGRFDAGVYKGVWAVALVIAKDAGVELTGEAPIDPDRLPRDDVAPISLIIALIVIFFIASLIMRSARRSRGASSIPWWVWMAGMGAGSRRSSRGGLGSFGSFGGGFSRGGFGGFGGGRTGGGGAGRGW